LRRIFHLLALDVDSLSSLEVGTGDVCDERVQLVGRVLVLVALTRETHAHSERHVPDALGPHVLVETSVDANVRCAHLLLGEPTYLLYRARRPLFEPDAMDALVNVDGVFTSRDLIGHRLLLATLLLRRRHLRCLQEIILWMKGGNKKKNRMCSGY